MYGLIAMRRCDLQFIKDASIFHYKFRNGIIGMRATKRVAVHF